MKNQISFHSRVVKAIAKTLLNPRLIRAMGLLTFFVTLALLFNLDTSSPWLCYAWDCDPPCDSKWNCDKATGAWCCKCKNDYCDPDVDPGCYGEITCCRPPGPSSGDCDTFKIPGCYGDPTKPPPPPASPTPINTPEPTLTNTPVPTQPPQPTKKSTQPPPPPREATATKIIYYPTWTPSPTPIPEGLCITSPDQVPWPEGREALELMVELGILEISEEIPFCFEPITRLEGGVAAAIVLGLHENLPDEPSWFFSDLKELFEKQETDEPVITKEQLIILEALEDKGYYPEDIWWKGERHLFAPLEYLYRDVGLIWPMIVAFGPEYRPEWTCFNVFQDLQCQGTTWTWTEAATGEYIYDIGLGSFYYCKEDCSEEPYWRVPFYVLLKRGLERSLQEKGLEATPTSTLTATP